jgi:hypothetical protein
MIRTNLRRTLLVTIGLLAALSMQAGSLEPPPGPVSPTRPPDTCFDNTGNRFVDCGDGTIKDTVTNLYWLKNANCFGARNWADANKEAAQLAHGQCGLTDGSLPGDWRLPTLACPSGGSCNFSTPPTGEFATIFAASCGPPYILDTAGTGCWSEGDPFSGVQSVHYWSASTHAALPVNAWIAYLGSGLTTTFDKTVPLVVWPVRGGP